MFSQDGRGLLSNGKICVAFLEGLYFFVCLFHVSRKSTWVGLIMTEHFKDLFGENDKHDGWIKGERSCLCLLTTFVAEPVDSLPVLLVISINKYSEQSGSKINCLCRIRSTLVVLNRSFSTRGLQVWNTWTCLTRSWAESHFTTSIKMFSHVDQLLIGRNIPNTEPRFVHAEAVWGEALGRFAESHFRQLQRK